MAKSTGKSSTDELDRQKSYAIGLAKQGFDYGLAVGSAFVESMRNTYYRHTGTALDELVDNSIEAGATNLHIAFGYSSKSDAKPDSIAVIDDGHGMVPEMLRLSVLWGGTHREGSRTGFGRFGFGLPSASVNQARRFSVFSLTQGGSWHAITIDLDDIREGKYNDATGRVVAPDVVKQAPPGWVLDYVKQSFPKTGLKNGSVVLWEKLDRLKWRTTSAMTKNLLEHFGVTYRKYLSSINIVLDGTRVEPTDPLFVTPGYRYFDVDEDRASPRDPANFLVASKLTGEKAKVSIRYAKFPRHFFSIDKTKDASKGNANSRFAVANAHRGIIVTRMGRQIDVVEHTPWDGFEKFRNDDRYWAVEVDFPAELDEEFTISNSKQGVVLSDRLWDLLEDAGLRNALRALRAEVVAEQKAQKSEREKPDEARASERSMAESEKFRRNRTETNPVEREQKAREALDQYVKRKARDTDRPEKEVREEALEEAIKHPYRVEFADLPGAPFFRVEQRGGMKVLEVNRSHRFYSDLYADPAATRAFRAGLEVLLFSIGACELDAAGNADKRTFYAVERAAWSEVLASGLEMLSRFVEETDIKDI